MELNQWKMQAKSVANASHLPELQITQNICAVPGNNPLALNE
ncbi:hypothetical protein ACVFI8_04665 [Agarivorans sp. MS3-6]|nr:hypothetical protein [Agarivorans sp. TSD2052]